MGPRIAIGAIIAILLGGTGYFAQQSQSTHELLQQREAELKQEKENSEKLKQNILAFKDIEKNMKGLESRLASVSATANTRMEELDKLIAEKNTAIEQEKANSQILKTALEENRTTLENERKARAEETKSLKAQVQEANRLTAEKNAAIKLEKAKIRNLKVTLDILNSTQENVRKVRAEGMERLEAKAKETSRLIAEKNTALKREKAKIRNLEATLDILNSSLDNERKARAEEIKRFESQAQKTSRLIEEKNAAIEKEKTNARKFELALKQIQANLKSDRKTQALVDKLSKQSLELAAAQVKEIKRLESVRGTLEAQLQRMDRLIASAQKEAKKDDIAAKPKTLSPTAKVKALNGELARKRAEEIARLDKTRALLKTQVQEMGQLIEEKNAGIAREKTKAQNLELALNQIRTSLDDERQERAKAEKTNARNAELARIRADEVGRLTKDKELQQAQIQEMSQLIAEKTSVAELIKNKLDQTNLSLAETIKKHTLAIARSKVLEKRAREEAERAKRLEADLSELDAKLKKQTVNLEQTRDQLRVTIVNSLLFDSGSATLRKEGSEALSNIADFLQKQKDKTIRIEGHTDNRPIKGNLLDRYPTNWELSFARAISIVKYLESKNISPARMSATGHSFYRPVASNDSEEGRARNRRTVILLGSPRPAVEGSVR